MAYGPFGNPVSSYNCQKKTFVSALFFGAPTTMLNRARAPLQCTAGSRTAIPLVCCAPARPKPRLRVRFVSVRLVIEPLGVPSHRSPPRGAYNVAPRWLPKPAPTPRKTLEMTLSFSSVGWGTWVTKRIGLAAFTSGRPMIKIKPRKLFRREYLRLEQLAPQIHFALICRAAYSIPGTKA